MYPFIRFFWGIYRASFQPRLYGATDMHVSHHICMPWDIDMFLELNNGRVLSLYDLGRFQMAQRLGMIAAIRRMGWALSIAGVSVRYRRRITAFERFEVRSRFLCWDERFLYLEQSMWKRNGECASHVLYRAAAIEKGKAVPPAQVATALGHDEVSPPMPDWVAAWITAEAERPWPPMEDSQSTQT